MEFTKIFEKFPIVETQKIRLRQLTEEDACDLLEYYSNENVYQHLDWNGPETLERSYKVIDIWNKGYSEGWIIRFAIADIVTNKVIGTIFLSEFEGKRAEVGYELSEKYWRRGIMSEALNEVLKIGFNQLELTRIQAFVCKENEGSMKMLEKYNFIKEGYLRQYECHSVTGECKDMYVFGLLNTEFNG